jgi:hypothetical protein
MRLGALLNPMKYVHGIRFLSRCLGKRALVERCLTNERLFECLVQDPVFLEQCLANQGYFEVFLGSRQDLQAFAIDEGTLIFDVERELVREAVQKSNLIPGPIIEVGTLFGFTTTRMAVAAKPNKKIITVDNYCWNRWGLSPDVHRRLTRRFLAYLIDTGGVEVVDMDKNAFFDRYQGDRPSFVFLDAVHTYEETRKDIEWAKRVGAAIIAGHDYSDAFEGVGRAVEEAGGVCRRAGAVWVLKTPYWEPAGAEPGLARLA